MRNQTLHRLTSSSKRRGIAGWALLGLAFLLTNSGKGVAQGNRLQNATVALDHDWQFREVAPGSQGPLTSWLRANVPGDVHLDLLANKKIPDPFYSNNESKLQWIEDASWEYRLNFNIAPAFLIRTNVDLVFDGLDSAAQVYLNGIKVLSADNMFRVWRVAVKDRLHLGMNELRVVFPPPIKAAEQAAATDPWQPETKTEAKTYIRKAAYEYGWDWGPRFVTSGIWRPVRLEAWDKVRIADFAIHQCDVSAEVVHLDAEVEIDASDNYRAKVNIEYSTNGASKNLNRKVYLHIGKNYIEFPIEIRQPRLWYPAGYGNQPLYEFVARIGKGRELTEERTVTVGLRSIVLRRQLDQWGRSFEFVVNGIPIFAKGADVIPFDSFPNRVTTADYRRILESARDANMNMIRLWGGGYYETDDYYQICDELGIMVWQDFMFGNDWQPGTYAFKQNVEAEAEDQVRRLRNHPSIVLWCGNNETEKAMDWHGRTALPPKVRFQMWQDYLVEFSSILNRVVARLDPEIPYWPSSPSADYEPTNDHFQSGDAHDWSVWHRRAPFTEYEEHPWRFVTEYGVESFPQMPTIQSFTMPKDRTDIFTPVMLAHQKSSEGNSLIDYYIRQYYPEPKDFASLLYVSQVMQAEGVKIGAEFFRRNRPETMGSLFWQLNDCWPVASWSAIDYYGRWKALQFYARRFYAPILVSPNVEDTSLKVYIVSDKTKSQPALLHVRLMDFGGKVLLDEARHVNVAPLASKVYLEWPIKKLTDAGAKDTSRVFVVAELTAGGTEISRNLIYLAPVKDVHLTPAHLTVKCTGAREIYKIRISSPVLARDVYLSFGDLDVKVSDNFVDLLPGEMREITANTSAPLDVLKAQLKIVSLTDAFTSTLGPLSANTAH